MIVYVVDYAGYREPVMESSEARKTKKMYIMKKSLAGAGYRTNVPHGDVFETPQEAVDAWVASMKKQIDQKSRELEQLREALEVGKKLAE